MVDIHSHIYPGIDDGSPSMESSLMMLMMAADSGVTDIVATPHCNIPDEYDNYHNEDWVYGFQELQERAAAMHIPIRIHPGQEVYGTDGVVDMLRAGRLIGINETRRVLIEFSFAEEPIRIYHWLHELLRAGYQPIVAHPERYPYVQSDLHLVEDWLYDGCLIQVNKGSILGRFGEGPCQAAWQLLNRNLVSCVASDAHSYQFRTTGMTEVYRELCDRLSWEAAEFLLSENPMRIVRGERAEAVFRPGRGQ